MHEGFWEECCCNEARQIEEDAQFDAGDHEARLATPTSIEEAFETHIGFRVGNQVEERMPRFADAVRRRFEQAVWQALREHCADSFEVARAILGGAGHCGMGARFREADLIAFARTVARRVIARPEPMRELLLYCGIGGAYYDHAEASSAVSPAFLDAVEVLDSILQIVVGMDAILLAWRPTGESIKVAIGHGTVEYYTRSLAPALAAGPAAARAKHLGEWLDHIWVHSSEGAYQAAQVLGHPFKSAVQAARDEILAGGWPNPDVTATEGALLILADWSARVDEEYRNPTPQNLRRRMGLEIHAAMNCVHDAASWDRAASRVTEFANELDAGIVMGLMCALLPEPEGHSPPTLRALTEAGSVVIDKLLREAMASGRLKNDVVRDLLAGGAEIRERILLALSLTNQESFERTG